MITDFRPEGIDDYEYAEDVAIQTDDKIVIAGWASMRQHETFALARYSTTGSPDPTFGTAGLVRTDVGNGNSHAKSVAIQAGDKIVAAGGWSGAGAGVALARYDANGILDTTFGSRGKVTSTLPVSGAKDLALQPSDGKIVVVGYEALDFAVARYLANGMPDPGFGKGGSVSTDLGGTDSANAVVVQGDGKIVAAGTSRPVDDGPKFALARYHG